jgi:DNA repair protein RecO (recombination protein O)
LKQNDKGFLIQRIPFSETSIIVKIFTENQGLKSFMIKGGRKKHASILQALSYIEFTFYQKNDEQLANLYEPHLIGNFQELYFHPVKQSALFCMNEFIQQSLHDGQEEQHLFSFVEKELIYLNKNSFSPNYLLYWVLELSFYLGIKPNVINEGNSFDLINGEIGENLHENSQVITSNSVNILAKIINSSKEEILSLDISKNERKDCFEILLKYFSIHLDTFKKINSFDIYQTLWYD